MLHVFRENGSFRAFRAVTRRGAAARLVYRKTIIFQAMTIQFPVISRFNQSSANWISTWVAPRCHWILDNLRRSSLPLPLPPSPPPPHPHRRWENCIPHLSNVCAPPRGAHIIPSPLPSPSPRSPRPIHATSLRTFRKGTPSLPPNRPPRFFLFFPRSGAPPRRISPREFLSALSALQKVTS